MKYIFIVISFFALICNLHAQSIVHLCVGDADKNFSVPYHIGSSYTWTIVDNSNIAVIYKQYPISDNNYKINIGSSIDLYFK